MSTVAIVTDSTASLPAELAAARGIHVVPLQVVVGASTYDEGAPAATPDAIAAALKEWVPVSTSRPAPAVMLQAYRALAAAGATEIVSIHLSGEMSGTFESAQLAAADSPVPVHAVDSRLVGIATGLSVLAAADAVAGGADGTEAAAVARSRAADTTVLFYVDTLEHLRRGGRMGAAAALLGSALSVKPILKVEDGKVVPHERVRTAGKALARIEELAVQAAGDTEVDVAVAHLANAERAAALAKGLGTRLVDQLAGREVLLGEIGAVLGAHVGPGMVAVTVCTR